MASLSRTLHATSVAFQGRALLITGASGRGKSALALELLARGAELIADDRTIVTQQNGGLIASCPEPIRGQIEARFVGILRATPAEPTKVELMVNLDHVEHERLPCARQEVIMGVSLPCLHKCAGSHFPAALLQYLKEGRYD